MSRKVTFHGGEFRYAGPHRAGGKEYLDEIVVANPKHVHVEVMDNNLIWMGIQLADGSQIMVHFKSVNGRAHIEYTAEIEKP